MMSSSGKAPPKTTTTEPESVVVAAVTTDPPDVANYKRMVRARLKRFVDNAEAGEYAFDPCDHDNRSIIIRIAIDEFGLYATSEGEEPERYVTVEKAGEMAERREREKADEAMRLLIDANNNKNGGGDDDEGGSNNAKKRRKHADRPAPLELVPLNTVKRDRTTIEEVMSKRG